jgi:hypothetical protein
MQKSSRNKQKFTQSQVIDRLVSANINNTAQLKNILTVITKLNERIDDLEKKLDDFKSI